MIYKVTITIETILCFKIHKMSSIRNQFKKKLGRHCLFFLQGSVALLISYLCNTMPILNSLNTPCHWCDLHSHVQSHLKKVIKPWPGLNKGLGVIDNTRVINSMRMYIFMYETYVQLFKK